jgi:AcrR family transcriptional regulator
LVIQLMMALPMMPTNDPKRRAPSERETARTRFAALPPERQAQLLDPAETEFVAHGFEGASLNRILAAANMSKGQAYYYVTDKADLYRTVIERALRRFEHAIEAEFPSAGSADEFWRHIARLFARLSEALRNDAKLAALARGVYEGPGARAALAEPLARMRLQLDKLITIGQSIGAVRADVPRTLLADTLFAAASAIDQWFARHWLDLSEQEALTLNEKAVGMIAAMAAPDLPC